MKSGETAPYLVKSAEAMVLPGFLLLGLWTIGVKLVQSILCALPARAPNLSLSIQDVTAVFVVVGAHVLTSYRTNLIACWAISYEPLHNNVC
jgi:hypothetical protein